MCIYGISKGFCCRRPQRLFRHSFLAQYDIYNIATNHRVQLKPDPLEFAMWGPVGSSLAFVFGANIYYRETPESQDVRVTTSGLPGVVFNGVADWVYEEEVLEDTKAIYFSPDGDRLAWIEFNDTDVDVMTIPHYGQPGNKTQLRYPKPGRKNPTVNVFAAAVRGVRGLPRARRMVRYLLFVSALTTPFLPSNRPVTLTTERSTSTP